MGRLIVTRLSDILGISYSDANISSGIFLADGPAIGVTNVLYDQTAALPTSEVNFATVTAGSTITVKSSGGDYDTLQAAWNSITSRTDHIEIVVDAAFDPGPLVTDAQTGDGTYWVVIRSANSGSLPRHVRVGPSDKSDMFQLTVPAVTRVIEVGANTKRVRFIGMSIEMDGSSYTDRQCSIDGTAEYIIIDRCLSQGGGYSQNCKRGWTLSGENIGVIDSYLYDIAHNSADNQALWIHEGAGPFTIVNCFLEGAGMCFMAGGSNPSAEAMLPHDITLSRCHMYKNPAWAAESLVVKNIFELKHGVRVLCEDTIMENFWLPDQDTAINLKTVNQGSDPAKTWMECGHVTLRWIRLMDAPSAMKFNGLPEPPGVRLHDVSVHDIVMYDLGSYATEAYGNGHEFAISDIGGTISVKNVTGIMSADSGGTLLKTYGTPSNDLVFKDNILAYLTYGAKGDGQSSGFNTLNTYFDTHDFTYNGLYWTGTADDLTGKYDSSNQEWDDIAACGFENAAADDYRLASGSSLKGTGYGGYDPGCDVATLNTRLTNVESGDFSSNPWSS